MAELTRNCQPENRKRSGRQARDVVRHCAVRTDAPAFWPTHEPHCQGTFILELKEHRPMQIVGAGLVWLRRFSLSIWHVSAPVIRHYCVRSTAGSLGTDWGEQSGHWRRPLLYVRADTVTCWQRERLRRFWARLSKRHGRRRRGRPATAVEIGRAAKLL